MNAQPTLPVFNLAVGHRPDSVTWVDHDTDLVDLVKRAASAGASLTAMGAGHGPEPITAGTALVTRHLNSVDIDPVARTARIGAGATWDDVVAAAAPFGLAPVTGSSLGVGVVGFLLGGGLSPLGRSLGWASERIRSMDIVTGAGEQITVTATSHPDLFWALRGGKRAPGLVTAVEIDLLELDTIVGGGIFFDGTDAREVLTGWLEVTAAVSEQVTTSAALLQLPDLPSLPAPIRGRFVVHIRVAAVASPQEAEPVLAELRGLATPLFDTVAPMPYAEIAAIHNDPVEPMPALDAGRLLDRLTPAAIDALLEAAGPESRSPWAMVELRHLGGALARSPHLPDAVAGREAAYSLFAVSLPDPNLFHSVAPAAMVRLRDAMADCAGGVQPNFIGSLNPPGTLAQAWPAETSRRLQQIWREHDPDQVFVR